MASIGAQDEDGNFAKAISKHAQPSFSPEVERYIKVVLLVVSRFKIVGCKLLCITKLPIISEHCEF